MGWESSGVVGFDLGPPLQGQTRIAKLISTYNSLGMVHQPIGNHGLEICWCGWISPLAPASRSNEGSQT